MDGTDLDAGAVLAGKYRVERQLGEGGMGVVMLARHLGLDELVAVKLLRTETMASTGVVERFMREARATTKIKSDHVVRVTDVDVLPSGAPYMVMEYLEGRDLAAHVAERGPLPPAEAIEYVLQACEAVGEAHELGIVHRDLKPANLFLMRKRDGTTRVKVLDFGISKIVDAAGGGGGLTGTMAVFGSPHYMSPEQTLSSRDVDCRTDIWAFGVILYELATGKVPFPGTTLVQVCAAILRDAPLRPRELRADLPVELETIILRCLEKDRAHRFASVPDLVTALRAVVVGSAQASIARTVELAVPSVPTSDLGQTDVGLGLPNELAIERSHPANATAPFPLAAVSSAPAVTSHGWGSTASGPALPDAAALGQATKPPARSRGGLAAVAAAFVLLGVGAVALLVGLSRHAGPTTAHTPEVIAVAPASPTPGPAPSPSIEVAPAATVVAAPASSPPGSPVVSATPSAPSSARVSTGPKTSARPLGTSQPSVQPHSAPSADPFGGARR